MFLTKRLKKKGKSCMLGELFTDTTTFIAESSNLLEELNKGLDDIENNRITSHEKTMEILMQQYNNYVSQNS